MWYKFEGSFVVLLGKLERIVIIVLVVVRNIWVLVCIIIVFGLFCDFGEF